MVEALRETLEVQLAGHVRIGHAGHELGGRDLEGGLARRAFAVLALERRPVPRDELADDLWGEHLPRTWSTGLRGALAKVRKALRTIGADEHLASATGWVELVEPVRVDLLDAEAAVAQADSLRLAGDPLRAARIAGDAAAVLSHPLLPGDRSDWADSQRRRFGELRLTALLQQSNCAREVGVRSVALKAARTAIRIDPLREAGHVALARAHLDGGDRAAALLALRRCEEIMHAELGVPLSPATAAFRRTVLDSLGVEASP